MDSRVDGRQWYLQVSAGGNTGGGDWTEVKLRSLFLELTSMFLPWGWRTHHFRAGYLGDDRLDPPRWQFAFSGRSHTLLLVIICFGKRPRASDRCGKKAGSIGGYFGTEGLQEKFPCLGQHSSPPGDHSQTGAL